MTALQPRSLLAPRLAALALVLGALGAPQPAEAKGTFFLVELSTGLAESAYRDGPVGLAYGASFGTTFKLVRFPVRWALLATVVGRNNTADGFHEGVPYSAERRDLDVYLAGRGIIPLYGALRGYLEVGAGARWQSQLLERGSDLGAIGSRSSEPLLVLAAGLEARVSPLLSLGIRGELDPLEGDPDLSTLAAGLAPTSNRASLLAQIGIHF